MLPFFMQAFVNQGVNCRNGIVRTPWLIRKLMPLFYRLLQRRITLFDRKMQAWRYYCRSETVFELAHYAGQILDLSNQFGEGWMIAADVASFDRQGITRVVCLQPFGCIANHIVAKGIERRLKLFYPRVNLLYLDIDGGMAEVNLHNRIQFLLANANL
jgi:predicted nucleotide-binding protein (sugar kinase/HSP70/actin superfamily)